MHQRRDYKDVWCLFAMTASLGCLAFAFVGLPMLPIRGQSADEVARIARDKARHDVLQVSLPSDDGDWAPQEIEARWQQMEDEDKSPSRRVALEKARQVFAARTWPVITRQGYVGNTSCWIVVSSWRATLQGLFCGMTTESEKAEMVADGTDRNTEIAVVEANAPYRVLFYSPRRPQLGLG